MTAIGTSKADAAIDTGREDLGITTLASRVRDRARDTPDRVAMRYKDFGIWQQITWSQYWDRVELVGHALLALGLEPGDRVAIHSEDRPEWLYTDMGTVAVRGITVGLYPTNPPAEVQHQLGDCTATLLIAEDQEQVDKALAVADELPALQRIVYLEPRGIRRHYNDERLMFWDDFLELGLRHRAENPGTVANRMKAAEESDVLTLIYTSGTTGPPKGAMWTVRNVEFAISLLVTGGGLTSPPPMARDLVLSYLPLCHGAERIFTVWFSSVAGVQVNFAESIATVQSNLIEVQPTIFLGVPRIWEKILAGVRIRLAGATPVKRAIGAGWLRVADWIGDQLVRRGGRHTALTRLVYAIGWVCWFRALRDRIGLRHARYAVSGAAPIAPEVLKFFMGIGVPMFEAYAQTENTSVATAMRPGRIKLGTVGEVLPGIELRIDEATGEIMTRHPANFAGYWNNPEATAVTIDEDGWLHTGDVGEWVDGTYVKITDRMKDIIITAGGKNITPSEMENALKASPYIKEAIVIGDKRPFCSALIGIELDTVGDWAQRQNIPYTTYRDLSEKPQVAELMWSIVNETNQRFARVAQVRDFRLLPKELDHEDGEITATQKVKRAAISEAFDDLIGSIYAGGTR